MPRIGSAGVNLPFPGINGGLIGNARSLSAGVKHIIPAGIYQYSLGSYTGIQVFDPVSQLWQFVDIGGGGWIESDGVNFRIANLSGTLVGANLTTAGTGYLTPPTISASAGGATFKAILGGSVSATVSVATGGVGYNHAPQVLVGSPPAGGLQATAVATISGGAISAVSMVNVGAGYLTAPAIIVVADPADTITTAASVIATLTTGVSTNLTAIVVTDPGTAVTAVPTLTISAAPAGGTTAIAAAIPLFTVTGLTVTGTGSAYGNTQPYQVLGAGALAPGTQAVTNPGNGSGLFQPAPFSAYGTTINGGLFSVTNGFTISNGGLHQTVPGVVVLAGGTTVPTIFAAATALVGGVTDTSFFAQIV